MLWFQDSYDSRLSFCCFPSLTIDSGSFTHVGWCFPPLLTWVHPAGSPAQLRQVEPQGRLRWVSREGSNLCMPCPVSTQALHQNILFWWISKTRRYKTYGEYSECIYLLCPFGLLPSSPSFFPPSQFLIFHASIFIFAFSDLCLL